ncbi:MAG: sensor histidine kinase [Saprospiraceae bacterium]
MLKNISPRKLSLYVAAFVSVIVLLIFAAFYYVELLRIQWWVLPIISVSFFLFIYRLMIFVLGEYIYRKVKLIYKNIHSTKREKLLKKGSKGVIQMNEDLLGNVEKDVSEWAESQAKEIASLRDLEEYRRDFLGNISHELKTPIFNMQGYLFTLLEGGIYDENINEEYVRRALVNVQRLQTIVTDLDVISKLEANKIKLEITSFDIIGLIEECFEDNQMLAAERKIKLAFKSGADTSFLVKGDRENIRQVLNNLIGNSIKYGKENGNTKIGCYNMETYILVEVEDDGIGIAKKDMKHVFDRFYRADKSRSRTVDGSGLGLSIVKHVMEAHKQTINVRSKEGRGSTFGFTLERA